MADRCSWDEMLLRKVLHTATYLLYSQFNFSTFPTSECNLLAGSTWLTLKMETQRVSERKQNAIVSQWEGLSLLSTSIEPQQGKERQGGQQYRATYYS